MQHHYPQLSAIVVAGQAAVAEGMSGIHLLQGTWVVEGILHIACTGCNLKTAMIKFTFSAAKQLAVVVVVVQPGLVADKRPCFLPH